MMPSLTADDRIILLAILGSGAVFLVARYIAMRFVRPRWAALIGAGACVGAGLLLQSDVIGMIALGVAIVGAVVFLRGEPPVT